MHLVMLKVPSARIIAVICTHPQVAFAAKLKSYELRRDVDATRIAMNIRGQVPMYPQDGMWFVRAGIKIRLLRWMPTKMVSISSISNDVRHRHIVLQLRLPINLV